MKRLALIGCGAIAQALMARLQGDAQLQLTQLVVRSARLAEAQALCRTLAPAARVLTRLDLDAADCPDLVAECAGHGAVLEHALPALRAGVPVLLASIGALHDTELQRQLEAAAGLGGTQLQLVSGAIGGIDALAAAKLGGLSQVHYTGRKPPRGWLGTPADAVADLAALRSAQVVFDGSAREAARLFPKNANVAATVSLAGLGFDQTRATLIADPAVTRNVHRLQAQGGFGLLDLTIENEPLAENPKSSALTVYSLLRGLHNSSRTVSL